jgi:perosamine synthetase
MPENAAMPDEAANSESVATSMPPVRTERLAIEGGTPVRAALLPYGKQSIDDADIAAVADVLRSDWLTTGPAVAAFEQALADRVNTACAVAFNSGTAALHALMHAIDLKPGDEVIVPTLTFASTANVVLFAGAIPVFCDVDSSTLLADPASVADRITPRTRAIVAVDFAGQPCAYEALSDIATRHGVSLLSDGCHALGARYRGNPVGCLTRLTAFSFHPVKAITTGEGGAVTTSDTELAERMRSFRNHCMNRDHHARAAGGSWEYAIAELGWNYRLSDIQCALGLSQLARLEAFIARRRLIAGWYDVRLRDLPHVEPLAVGDGVDHAYHLYVVQLEPAALAVDRSAVFSALRAEGIGVNVHYQPVHLQPLYRDRLGTGPGDCPVAEAAYEHILSLPIFPAMTEQDVDDVVTALAKVLLAYQR